MDCLRLGKTGLRCGRTAFGALPIQRVDFETARTILRAALRGGVNFFDTANAYSDSEEKIGFSLAEDRPRIVLATKTGAATRAEAMKHIRLSCERMKTDYLDLVQLHNPKELPDPQDDNSAYAALVAAKREGIVRHIGFTAHRLENAVAAVESGLFETVQYPLSALSSKRELELIGLCRDHDVGLIAMKALCGGLLDNARAAFAFLRRFDNVLPIWGIQRIEELEEFLALEANPPHLDVTLAGEIQRITDELGADFCRGCGYCLPCPAEIPIPMAARMRYLLRRAPTENFLSPEWQAKMARIKNCTECDQCRQRCPYDLDAPRILREMLADYEAVVANGGV